MIFNVHPKIPYKLILSCATATDIGIWPQKSLKGDTCISVPYPCANHMAKFVYALLTATKIIYPDSVDWGVVVHVSGSKTKFTVDSKNVVTALTKKLNCHIGHSDPELFDKVYEVGPKIGQEVALDYAMKMKVAPAWMPTVEGTWELKTPSLQPEPKTLLKPKPKLNLNKVGYMDIVTTPIVSNINLSGENNKLHNLDRRCVLNAVYMFYAIEELYATGIVPKPRRDIYVANVSRSMFDYLASISLVEARHAKGVSWSVFHTHSGDTRSYAMEKMYKFDPRQFLPVTKHLFDESGCWEGSFGGEPWAKIADAAIRYFNTPHGAWFDQVVDLSHHGGLAFNKGYIWDQGFPQSYYRDMLDCKSNNSIFDWKAGLGLIRPEELRWLSWAMGGTEEYGPTVKTLNWIGTEVINAQLNRDYLNEDEETNEERTERRIEEREAKPKWKLERPE